MGREYIRRRDTDREEKHTERKYIQIRNSLQRKNIYKKEKSE